MNVTDTNAPGERAGMDASRALTVGGLVCGLAVLTGGLVDLPSNVGIGMASTLAMLGLLGGAWILTPRIPRPGVAASTALAASLFVLVMGWLRNLHSQQGGQLVAVTAAFMLAFLLGLATMESSDVSSRSLYLLFHWAAWLACALYGASLALGGLGSAAVVGSRSFGLVALVFLPVSLAAWRLLGRRASGVQAFVLTVLVFASLSRTAAILALICWLWPSPATGRRLTKLVFRLSVVLLGLIYGLPVLLPGFLARFTVGDAAATVGGLELNTSGRVVLWSETLDRWRESPLVGLGAGSINDVLFARHGIQHPHNEYLRMLADLGIVGLGSWLIFSVVLLSRLTTSHARTPPEDSWLPYAARMAFALLLLSAVTDNSLSYLFVLAPAGVLFGTALVAAGGTSRNGYPSHSRAVGAGSDDPMPWVRKKGGQCA